MKSMSCKDLGGPCEQRFTGKDANEIINAQDAHLKAMARPATPLTRKRRRR